MIQLPPWLGLTILTVAGLLIFFGRAWFKALAESAARHIFNEEIEKVRSELRMSEERLKADLVTKENEIRSLREAGLAGFGQRAAMLNERKLVAAERLWRSVSELAKLKTTAMALSLLKIDEVAKRIKTDSGMRDLMRTLTFEIDMKNLPPAIFVQPERPFLPPMVWALYQAMLTTLLGYMSVMQMLAAGVNEPLKVISTSSMADMMKKALPEHSDYIDKFGWTGNFHLLEYLEEKMLRELVASLEGVSVDHENLARATEISQLARKAFPTAEGASS